MASKRSESIMVMKKLRRDADKIAAHFGLKYKELRAEKSGVYGHYGICYDDGTIRIRLRHASSGKLLKYSSLVNTLCHELAHLRYFDHGEGFKRFYFQILQWAREQKIYQPKQQVKPAPIPTAVQKPTRPDRPQPLQPVQLSLFG